MKQSTLESLKGVEQIALVHSVIRDRLTRLHDLRPALRKLSTSPRHFARVTWLVQL
jgi:hypothetical protein